MDLEREVALLTASLESLWQERLADEMLLRAIIVSRPDDRKLISAALSLIASERADAVRSLGFDQSWSPEQVEAMNAGIGRSIDRWLDWLKK